jgi:hypothetical protein
VHRFSVLVSQMKGWKVGTGVRVRVNRVSGWRREVGIGRRHLSSDRVHMKANQGEKAVWFGCDLGVIRGVYADNR